MPTPTTNNNPTHSHTPPTTLQQPPTIPTNLTSNIGAGSSSFDEHNNIGWAAGDTSVDGRIQLLTAPGGQREHKSTGQVLQVTFQPIF